MSIQLSRIQSAIIFLLGLSFFFSVSTQAAVTNVSAGQSYSLSVSADGTAPFSYQWFHDGAVVSGVAGAVYSGSAASSDGGVYYAKVTNAAGSATSDSVTLVVVSPPVFTTQPTSQVVAAGASVTLIATVSGTPVPAYQWRFNGTAIPGATNGSLTMANVQAGNAGSYTLAATNSVGSITSSVATLTVIAVTSAPVITTQPVSQTVSAGAGVTFTAAASGAPAPSYQWKVNGVSVPGLTSGSLSIANAQLADAGSYTMIATNSAGSVTSTAANLTVNAATVAPLFTTQPVSQAVTTGANVTFVAAASGTPAPVYQWRKDGAVVSGANSSSFSLAPATASSAGTYTVVASNVAGATTSAGATLTVNSSATAPNFTLQPVSQAVKKGASVTFSALATGFPASVYQWRKNGAVIAGATGASYTLSNLVSTNAGSYTVVATNPSGSTTSTAAVLTVTSAAAALASVDFNLDNKTDIIWQDITTGEFNVWFMNGTSKDDSVSLGNFSTQWKIGGVADFNADGYPDILCQNTVTGEWSIWLMSGLEVASKISLGIQPLNFRICGVGDFNGDNHPDIVVQDSATRQISLWIMSGTQCSAVITVGTPAANWQVCGSGDFNVDGQSDLVLQNSVTGQVNLWFLSGGKITWKTGLTAASPEWQVCGTGDFDGDGRADILCQNVLTGECSLWLVGRNNTVSKKVSLGTMPVDWVIRN